MAYRSQRGRLGYAPEPTVQTYTFPASVGGVNALDSLMMMPPQDCIHACNLMPVEYGQQLRKGYREWATGVSGDIRTVLPYEAASQDPADDRLWAVSEDGIYTVTAYATTAPVQEIAFADQTGPAGYGVKTEWTDDAAQHYLFYADGTNGLYMYTDLNGWGYPGDGTYPAWTYDPGAAPGTAFVISDVAFITSHKLRLWVIKENSSDAYYTPVASIGGDLVKFTFGAKMPHGGNLQGLYTWTLDGGDGIDDYLVAVGRGGDVLVYRGADPSDASWTLVGSWFIGETPRSRRLAVEYGSEMYVLSTYGITSLRDLMEGAVANEIRNSPSAKVNRFLRADVKTGKDLYEWAITSHPPEGFIQVITPEPSNTPYTQYNQNVNTKAWGFWESVPVISAGTWNGNYYIGSPDGVLHIYDGTRDNATLAGAVGEPVCFRGLTSFQAPGGNHSTFKRAGLIRTIGITESGVSINVEAAYDYAIATSQPAVPPLGVETDSSWDSAIWDTGLWNGSIKGVSFPDGASGIGRTVAMSYAGQSDTRIIIVGWDLMYTEGGLL